MGKRLLHRTRSKERPGAPPARVQASSSPPLKETHPESILCNQLEGIFESLPDSIIVCDQEDKILWFNATALKLFEVASSAHWQGRSYQQFLQGYELSDECCQSISLEPWLMNLITDDERASCSQEKACMLHLPSGRKVYVNIWRFPLFDSQQHAIGTFSVFHSITHRYEKALHLQTVYEAISILIDAIAQIPEHIDLASSEETLLLSPPVTIVAQQLVNVICQVLKSRRVSLITYGAITGHQYYVAGSGLTPEQEQYWQKMNGRIPFSEFVDETVIARLSANQEVILTSASIHLPLLLSEFGTENYLFNPLFLEQQWVGTLVVVKIGVENRYTAEEIALVKAVAAQTMLIVECLSHLHKGIETQTRMLVQREIHRLSNDFLTLASHELLTPLTSIIGNIQLAQRRLEALKQRIVEQPERISEKFQHVQQPLASASKSAFLQKRMIQDIIDDALIQTKQFNLSMKHFNLSTLLKEVVNWQHRSTPERMIVLKMPSTEQSVPVLANAERITQVLNTYLTNALNHSPIEEPVIIELVVSDGVALVSVHDEGVGIPTEEQAFLWERFYRAKGSATQHELDLSLGLGFYLCRAIIEYHQGHVGVQSDPSHGETFWFTLPISECSEK